MLTLELKQTLITDLNKVADDIHRRIYEQLDDLNNQRVQAGWVSDIMVDIYRTVDEGIRARGVNDFEDFMAKVDDIIFRTNSEGPEFGVDKHFTDQNRLDIHMAVRRILTAHDIMCRK